MLREAIRCGLKINLKRKYIGFLKTGFFEMFDRSVSLDATFMTSFDGGLILYLLMV